MKFDLKTMALIILLGSQSAMAEIILVPKKDKPDVSNVELAIHAIGKFQELLPLSPEAYKKELINLSKVIVDITKDSFEPVYFPTSLYELFVMEFQEEHQLDEKSLELLDLMQKFQQDKLKILMGKISENEKAGYIVTMKKICTTSLTSCFSSLSEIGFGNIPSILVSSFGVGLDDPIWRQIKFAIDTELIKKIGHDFQKSYPELIKDFTNKVVIKLNDNFIKELADIEDKQSQLGKVLLYRATAGAGDKLDSTIGIAKDRSAGLSFGQSFFGGYLNDKGACVFFHASGKTGKEKPHFYVLPLGLEEKTILGDHLIQLNTAPAVANLFGRGIFHPLLELNNPYLEPYSGFNITEENLQKVLSQAIEPKNSILP